MNFTTCDKNCAYQKEGYCVLKEYNHINVMPECDCIYFVPTKTHVNTALATEE